LGKLGGGGVNGMGKMDEWEEGMDDVLALLNNGVGGNKRIVY
jgi:hypothetical protein